MLALQLIAAISAYHCPFNRLTMLLCSCDTIAAPLLTEHTYQQLASAETHESPCFFVPTPFTYSLSYFFKTEAGLLLLYLTRLHRLKSLIGRVTGVRPQISNLNKIIKISQRSLINV